MAKRFKKKNEKKIHETQTFLDIRDKSYERYHK